MTFAARVRSVRFAGGLVSAVLLVLVGSSLLPVSDVSAVGLPVALLLLVAAIAVVIERSACSVGGPSVGVAFAASSFETRELARQCNPDAAGHVRSRAPGLSAGRDGPLRPITIR
jgi:hypothetical protein